ncbi:winged helix-turn-helix transcriptional regulator [Haloferax sp. S1W]|uniref:winged helix-turn-helix transcriptional regulator n=1 Tax=Haloferax sp. S1W TaxID=3377110 RepID=UPI0037C57EC8
MAHSRQCACCETTRTDEDASVTCYCPLDGVITTVGRKYAMQIIALLGAQGPTRFSELEATLGVTSTSTLTDCLADLRDENLVERRSFDEIPPRVEYSLTPRGRELEVRLQPLLEWAATE